MKKKMTKIKNKKIWKLKHKIKNKNYKVKKVIMVRQNLKNKNLKIVKKMQKTNLTCLILKYYNLSKILSQTLHLNILLLKSFLIKSKHLQTIFILIT